MKILLTPEDIVKRCSWDNYVYYIIGSDKEGEKILKENTEFEISERDALIIGILKVLETDNLIHRFNTYVVDLLTNKSINNQNQALIKKKTLSIAIDRFLDKFPEYWDADASYKKGIKDLKKYMIEIKSDIDKLEITQITDQFGSYECLNSNSIKKLLSFNY